MNLNYHVLDIETTGLDNQKDEIAEIAIITCRNNEIHHIFHKYYSITQISEMASQKNHLTVEMLRGWPSFKSIDNISAIKSLLKFPVFAHNANFDIGFLKANNAIYDSVKVIDTVKLCKSKETKLENNRLQTWLNYYNINAGIAHSALGDALGLTRLILLQGWQIKIL